MRSSPIGFRPRSPFGYSGCRRSTSRAHGTTCSLSAKNLSPGVRLFLPAYSACEQLPCRCIVPPLGPPGPPDSTRSQNPQPTLFQCFPRRNSKVTKKLDDIVLEPTRTECKASLSIREACMDLPCKCKQFPN